MATTTHLVTVEEFSRLPDSPLRHELRHGEVTLMSAPPRYHADLEDRIYNWLLRHCETFYCIRMEFACRPLAEHEVWIVDVGLTTKERWNATKTDAWLSGAPELAIEVLSPSNTKREMDDRRETLFQGGCRHFWLVDYKTRTVTVSTPGGTDRTYNGADSLPLEPYSDTPLPLAEIFAGIE